MITTMIIPGQFDDAISDDDDYDVDIAIDDTTGNDTTNSSLSTVRTSVVEPVINNQMKYDKNSNNNNKLYHPTTSLSNTIAVTDDSLYDMKEFHDEDYDDNYDDDDDYDNDDDDDEYWYQKTKNFISKTQTISISKKPTASLVSSSTPTSSVSTPTQQHRSVSTATPKLPMQQQHQQQHIISHKVQNKVQHLQHMEYYKRTLHTDKNDRATSEQVLDPRTRYILFKLLQSNFLSQLNGCISTGKEANVYYAIAGTNTNNTSSSNNNTNTVNSEKKSKNHTSSKNDPLQQQQPQQQLQVNNITTTTTTDTTNDSKIQEKDNEITQYAIKIYKTSILVFKDRDKYVSGEYRYRNGYCKSNPRKMIQIWAEKEIRNYKRIYMASIPCPKPIYIKQHVLVMEFLGHNGWPSPRLKDVLFTDSQRNMKYYNIYQQCVLILRQLVQKCKLIHGDYSEYNLLYHNHIIYVIDVSQSVELNHPIAYDLLKQDIINITEYFKKIFYKSISTTTTTTTTNSEQSIEKKKNDDANPQQDDSCNDSSNMQNGSDDDTYYLLSPIEMFDYIMTTYTDTSDIYEKEQLHILLKNGLQRQQQLYDNNNNKDTEQLQKQQQNELMNERIFLNSYIPRTLNEITVTEKDYSIQQQQQQQVSKQSEQTTTFPSYEKQAIAAMTATTTITTTLPSITLTDSISTLNIKNQKKTAGIYHEIEHVDVDNDGSHKSPDVSYDNNNNNENHHINDDDDDGDDDDSCDDDDDDDDDQTFERIPRTPEELEHERNRKREERRTNKKLVKEQQSMKRQNKKIKKKDKKRAIAKSKA